MLTMSWTKTLSQGSKQKQSGAWRSNICHFCQQLQSSRTPILRSTFLTKEILVKTEDNLRRSVLPIPDVPRTGLTTYDAKDPDTKYPPIRDLRPPQGAPNVLIILIDDAGFGSASAFGGPCQTPNAEKLGT